MIYKQFSRRYLLFKHESSVLLTSLICNGGEIIAWKRNFSRKEMLAIFKKQLFSWYTGTSNLHLFTCIYLGLLVY